MPSAITEVAIFSPTILVPNDTEDANVASIIDTFVQPLANRTKYLDVQTVAAQNLAYANTVELANRAECGTWNLVEGTYTVGATMDLALVEKNGAFTESPAGKIALPDGWYLISLSVFALMADADLSFSLVMYKTGTAGSSRVMGLRSDRGSVDGYVAGASGTAVIHATGGDAKIQINVLYGDGFIYNQADDFPSLLSIVRIA